MSLPKRAVIWFMLCNIIVKGINFIATPLFAHVLSISEFGKLTLYTSYEQLIIVIATWEVTIGPYQRGLFKYKNDIPLFTGSTIVFANIITIIAFVIVAFFYKEIQYWTEFPTPILMSFGVYLLLQPAYNSWFYKKRVDYEYHQTVFATISIAVLSIVVPYIALVYLPKTAEVKFFFTLLPSAIIFLVLYIVQIRKIRIDDLVSMKRRVLKYWRFLLLFTPPLVIHAISYYILGQSDRIMIAKMDCKENAAIYSVAYTISSMAIIIQSALQQVLLPWIYKNLEKDNYSQINEKSNLMIVIMGVCYFVFILISPDVVYFLFPEEYHESIWCIPPIAIGSFFMFFYSIFVNIESYYEETKYIAYISVTCSILNVILNYFGLPIFGYIFCAYSTLFCYVLFALGHYYFMKKTLRKHCDNVIIFHGSKLLGIGVITLLAMSLILLAYTTLCFRIILLLTLITLVILYWRKMKELINQMRHEKN